MMSPRQSVSEVRQSVSPRRGMMSPRQSVSEVRQSVSPRRGGISPRRETLSIESGGTPVFPQQSFVLTLSDLGRWLVHATGRRAAQPADEDARRLGVCADRWGVARAAHAATFAPSRRAAASAGKLLRENWVDGNRRGPPAGSSGDTHRAGTVAQNAPVGVAPVTDAGAGSAAGGQDGGAGVERIVASGYVIIVPKVHQPAQPVRYYCSQSAPAGRSPPNQVSPSSGGA